MEAKASDASEARVWRRGKVNGVGDERNGCAAADATVQD